MKPLLVLALIFIIVMMFVSECNSSARKKENETIEKAFWDKNLDLKNKKFQELTFDQKYVFLTQVILSEREPFSTIAYQLEMGLENKMKDYIKFPETIKYKNAMGWGDFAGFVSKSEIVDTNNGVLSTMGEFKSENKLGMEVRSKYVIIYKILDDNFIIEDISIE